MTESSANIVGEKAKKGTKRRNASQLIENKNTSKKNISVDCIFLKAKKIYIEDVKEERENINIIVETAIG